MDPRGSPSSPGSEELQAAVRLHTVQHGGGHKAALDIKLLAPLAGSLGCSAAVKHFADSKDRRRPQFMVDIAKLQLS